MWTGRGIYTCSANTYFGERPSTPETVVNAIIQQTDEIVPASGAATTNKLGLTTLMSL